VQYQQSIHRLGGNFERSTTSCAICHTHQGFLERIASNAYATAENIQDPAPVNCRTCHQIHKTYTAADYALTASAPVTFYWTGKTVDLGPQGNLCARCHQARQISPNPTLGGGNVTVSSSRYGAHHGPQGSILAGVGLYAFTGSSTVTAVPHVHGDPAFNPGTCASCHMNQAFGEQSGGHTFNMSYDYHGSEVENIAGCQECHKTVENFDHFGLRTEVKGLLAQLETELIRLGIRVASDDPHDYYAKSGTFPSDVVAAFANWQMVSEDRSNGMHNPSYVKSVLKNTIAKMKTY
jgi:hypothetical protein